MINRKRGSRRPKRGDGRRNNKPPENTKWRPGQSGNPSGRPKGSKSTSTIVKEILDQPVNAKIRGRDVKIPFRKAMLLKAADDFMDKSNLKALAFLLQLYEAAVAEKRPDETRPEDQEILRVFKKMIQDNKDNDDE
jgi:hypothetical protein